MGKKQHKIGIRLDDEQLGRVDAEIAMWIPFCSRRSTMIEALVEVALDAIRAGIVQRPIISMQRLQSSKLPTEGEPGGEAGKADRSAA